MAQIGASNVPSSISSPRLPQPNWLLQPSAAPGPKSKWYAYSGEADHPFRAKPIT
jgi:hypothetical protein